MAMWWRLALPKSTLTRAHLSHVFDIDFAVTQLTGQPIMVQPLPNDSHNSL